MAGDPGSRWGMVRVLYGTAITYGLVATTILLVPFLRHPSRDAIPHLIQPLFLFAPMLFVISVVYRRGTARPRAKRWLWFVGVLGLVSAASFILIDALARKTDAESAVMISGWLLVGIFGIAAARKATSALSATPEHGAQPPRAVNR